MSEAKTEKAAKRETLQDLEWKIDAALKSGEEWVETTEENIKYHCRGDVGAAGYFVYKGIKVCAYGHMEELAAKDGDPVPLVKDSILGAPVQGDPAVVRTPQAASPAGATS